MKTIVTILNISLYVFFLSYFFDVSVQNFDALYSIENSLLMATKIVGIGSILIAILMFLFLVYLFSIGLGGQLNSFKEYYILALNGLIIFNVYYVILFLFFDEAIRIKNHNHLIFTIGNLTYLLYTMWLVISIKFSVNIDLFRSTLSVIIPVVIITLFKFF